MVHKIMRVLPIPLFILVLFLVCSKADYEIKSITGYYMRATHGDFIIFIQNRSFSYPYTHIEIHFEPVEIYFAEGEEGEVPIDSLKTGDKIEVDIKEITEEYPRLASIYGLRLIEAGDVSNIGNYLLLTFEKLGYHAVIGEKTEQPPVVRYSGYFVRTETDCFLVPADEYGLLRDVDLLKIYPADEMGAPPDFDVSGVSLDGFKTGDMIWVDIMLVQELYPPISPICGAALIEEGDISDIEQDVVSKLSELGYTVIEAEL